jgi:hypothetical protein
MGDEYRVPVPVSFKLLTETQGLEIQKLKILFLKQVRYHRSGYLVTPALGYNTGHSKNIFKLLLLLLRGRYFSFEI